jgi:hypothetical protein
VGVIPVVGDLVAIAEFVYGASVHRDLWTGRRLSDADVALLGAFAAMSAVPLAGEASRAGRAVAGLGGRAADAAIARAIAALSGAIASSWPGSLAWSEIARR